MWRRVVTEAPNVATDETVGPSGPPAARPTDDAFESAPAHAERTLEVLAVTAGTAATPLPGLLEWLRANGVDHEVHEHPAAFTAASTAASEGVDARTFAKVVGVTAGHGRIALLVVDALDHVDLEKARAVLSAADVRLLDEADLADVTSGCEPGAMPAVGALFGLPLYADYALEDAPEISFNAGTHRLAVRVDRETWERAADVVYADLAIREERPAWATS